jgi:hypothetical protein
MRKCLISCGGDDILNYIEDILILGGLTIIVMATFLVSKVIGLYVLGTTMFGLGIFFSRHPPRR